MNLVAITFTNAEKVMFICVLGVLFFVLFRFQWLQDKRYLTAKREGIERQFKQINVVVTAPTFSVNGATAEVVHDDVSIVRHKGERPRYTFMRFVRNEHGEYFMFLSTEATPFVKHISHQAAKAVLKSKYRSPQK
jgi:hypothetical protein